MVLPGNFRKRIFISIKVRIGDDCQHLIHCTENLIYVFPQVKLCGLVPNSYIHVSVSDL
jgi:hypothetical protein